MAAGCNMDNTLPLENAFNVNIVKEECEDIDFADDKVHVSETAITEFQDSITCDNLTQCDISVFDDIKVEFSSSSEVQHDVTHDNIKTGEEIIADNIKNEFDNGLLYCEDCHIYYEDYCAKCGMLVHILNRTVPINADNISRELPNRDVLGMRECFGKFHIFALKPIPVGVRFGPFTGLDRTECSWKIKGGKFVVSKDKSKHLNWMQYINPARNISQQNLHVFQYEQKLYYESSRQIEEGDELLVHFAEEYDDSLIRNIEIDFAPTTKHIFKDAFACTFCCLGFSSRTYLAKHKTVCLENAAGEFTIEEVMQCPSCKIYVDQKEYSTNHMAYCCDINNRKPTTCDRATQVTLRKTRPLELYKCQQCKYKTKYKGDLQKHSNQHYRVKVYKCAVCCRRFKTKEVLRLHVASTRVCARRRKENSEHSTRVYMNTATKAENSRSHDEIKQFKCSLCEYRTTFKVNFKRHMGAKHLKDFNYKCATCDYKTNWRSDLRRHIQTKHLKVFKYNCERCDYKTNKKSNLKAHIEARHLEEFKYKCDRCDYKANWMSHFKTHIETKHFKEFKYWCQTCDYKTNRKSDLKRHTETRHLNDFKFEYGDKSNRESESKADMEIRHLKEFKYKCDRCDYKTNCKPHLKIHTETKHLKLFKYKCDGCDYKTNRKPDLKRHIETIHLKVFKYECGTCDYKAHRKSQLRNHIETKHLKEFKYKCDACDYKTYSKHALKNHIHTRHK